VEPQSDAAQAPAVIEAVGLTKIYGQGTRSFCAVESLTLTVPSGEVFGFLGPNGAGKTTTIKMLVGLLQPTRGMARIAGYELQSQPLEAKARTGYVPDNPFLYEKLTGREFMEFIADLYSLPRSIALQHRLEGLLSYQQLTPDADRLISSYSRGMRQKLALAAALLPNPRALFLDEPTVGLDPGSVRRLKDTLRSLAQEQGVAVFLSTHTLEVASEICDRVGIFHHGRLVALGPPRELSQQNSSGRLEDLFLQLTTEPTAQEPLPL
jgi:ABC-2 type transport system ATP-binding protein